MEKSAILVDVMGSDRGPAEIIKGCVNAASLVGNVDIVLLGPEDLIGAELDKTGHPGNIRIENAPEVIEMDEEPAWAVRNKSQSTIVVGSKLVRERKAQALVTPGNTGAVMAAALLIMGRIKGISRPAILVRFPIKKRNTYVLDAGANAECKPENLLEFAIMANSYLSSVLKIDNPSIGLLSIGEEKTKGNDLVKEAYSLLERSGLNFYGNVQGSDIARGTVDIIVCDGYTGNIVLKLSESLVKEVFKELKDVANSSLPAKIGSLLLKPSLRKMIKRLDYEEYGGTLLLGVNGVCVICHGSSSAKAITNAILQAVNAVEGRVVSKIKEDLKGKTSVHV
ncbi:MAG: phosphate acyltransferase PlsX [Firmicutes bacterium]|nr:phosphate acyltransferase PlsX [Bacillota bacterium]